MASKAVLTGIHFMNGDEACAEGALAAGCRFFGGYPITPATEVAERMALRLPQLGGVYIQMEDEIASMASLLGASWGGQKAMTSTSGPGFSLMMENLGLGICTETPCVVCNVQRAGPSTGLPTLVGQGDMMQARWGSHGPYEIIALSPSSPQEMFDFTIRAFNLSEQFRTPVLIMADEVVGHMNERVVIPEENTIKLVERKRPTGPPDQFLPFRPEADGVAPMACFGDGYRIHVTGLTHAENGYPAMEDKAQVRMVDALVNKINMNRRHNHRLRNRVSRRCRNSTRVLRHQRTLGPARYSPGPPAGPEARPGKTQYGLALSRRIYPRSVRPRARTDHA